ncbi:MAG: hypothetical protein JWM56_1426 [Candidatus Peribacteria bacterium]|nr:hypothetical protein [Candidatus Peribacteria bacterium]
MKAVEYNDRAVIRTHDFPVTGNEYELKNHIETWQTQARPGLIATDMDGTMFLEDAGRLVFNNFIESPEFFSRDPTDFNSLLLTSYPITEDGRSARDLVKNAAEGRGSELSAETCRDVLHECGNLTENYARLHSIGATSEDERRAFAQAFLALDQKLIDLKNTVQDFGLSNRLAEAFWRFRMTTGFPASHIASYAKRLADGGIRANSPVHQILHSAPKADTIHVITASPCVVARELIRASLYKTVITDHTVIPTTLQRSETDHLTGRIEGEMITGDVKRVLLQHLQRNTGATLRMALGDHPPGDGAMGALVLEKGGVFVITHEPEKFQTMRQAFHSVLAQFIEPDEHADRIWYVEQEALIS